MFHPRSFTLYCLLSCLLGEFIERQTAWTPTSRYSAITGLADGLVCYSCQNCSDPFQPTYIYAQWQNDTQTQYCTVSKRMRKGHRGTMMRNAHFQLENVAQLRHFPWNQPNLHSEWCDRQWELVLSNESLQQSRSNDVCPPRWIHSRPSSHRRCAQIDPKWSLIYFSPLYRLIIHHEWMIRIFSLKGVLSQSFVRAAEIIQILFNRLKLLERMKPRWETFCSKEAIEFILRIGSRKKH